jgi:hypothetical protein
VPFPRIGKVGLFSYLSALTRVVLHFEGGPDVVVSVGVHPEREGGAIALRPGGVKVTKLLFLRH